MCSQKRLGWRLFPASHPLSRRQQAEFVGSNFAKPSRVVSFLSAPCVSRAEPPSCLPLLACSLLALFPFFPSLPLR